MKRWKVEYQDLWLIFTRHGTKISEYPAIKRHLEKYREQLEPKPDDWPKDKDWPGRKPGSYKWYEIQDNIAYWQEFEKPKIIYPDIAHSCEFAIDRNGLYPDCTLFIIPEGTLHLIGILNSYVNKWFFPQICPKIRGGFMRFKSIYVSQIPIPSNGTTNNISPLISQILSHKGIKDSFEIESRLDAHVAHLYNLTLAEYTLILTDLKLSPVVRSACLGEFKKSAAEEE